MPAFLKWRCPATREKNVPPDMRCAQCRGFFLQGHCIRNIQKCKKNFHSKCPQRGDIPGATHSLHTVRQIWALVFWWGRGYTGVKRTGGRDCDETGIGSPSGPGAGAVGWGHGVLPAGAGDAQGDLVRAVGRPAPGGGAGATGGLCRSREPDSLRPHLPGSAGDPGTGRMDRGCGGAECPAGEAHPPGSREGGAGGRGSGPHGGVYGVLGSGEFPPDDGAVPAADWGAPGGRRGSTGGGDPPIPPGGGGGAPGGGAGGRRGSRPLQLYHAA